MRPPQVLVCRFVGLHLTALSAVSEGYIRTEYILALNSIRKTPKSSIVIKFLLRTTAETAKTHMPWRLLAVR
jgi:hypothetical protein